MLPVTVTGSAFDRKIVSVLPVPFCQVLVRARVLLTNRNPVTNETILDGWAESTSHDTECVTGTPCPTSVKNISFVTEWLRLGKSYQLVLRGKV